MKFHLFMFLQTQVHDPSYYERRGPVGARERLRGQQQRPSRYNHVCLFCNTNPKGCVTQESCRCDLSMLPSNKCKEIKSSSEILTL